MGDKEVLISTDNQAGDTTPIVAPPNSGDVADGLQEGGDEDFQPV